MNKGHGLLTYVVLASIIYIPLLWEVYKMIKPLMDKLAGLQ